MGAISAGGTEEYVENARKFGEIIGLCFQIRDDIFDYYDDASIGKPTGNDMMEGKITLPAIYAIKQSAREDVHRWAKNVKAGCATVEDIANLVEYTKQNGGIEYAEKRMKALHNEALSLLDKHWHNDSIKAALKDYIDFVVERSL